MVKIQLDSHNNRNHITIPKDIMAMMRWYPGDEVYFLPQKKGEVLLREIE